MISKLSRRLWARHNNYQSQTSSGVNLATIKWRNFQQVLKPPHCNGAEKHTYHKLKTFCVCQAVSLFLLLSLFLLFVIQSWIPTENKLICSISRLRHSHNVCTVNYEPYKEMALEEIALWSAHCEFSVRRTRAHERYRKLATLQRRVTVDFRCRSPSFQAHH